MPLPLSRSPLAAAAGAAFLCAALATSACSRPEEPAAAAGSTAPAPRPSILLVTLDTTRDDAIDWTPGNAVTPNLARLGEEGLRFRRAYATAPGFRAANDAMRAGRFTALDRLTIPVTLAWPEFDRLVARPRRLPAGVRSVVLRGCGHLPTWDDPEQVAHVLLDGSAA